jgi:hypothetical protein
MYVTLDIYVTLLIWQCEITTVVVFGIAMAMILFKISRLTSTSLRIGHLFITLCHTQDKCFSPEEFPFLISRFIDSGNHIHIHKF